MATSQPLVRSSCSGDTCHASRQAADRCLLFCSFLSFFIRVADFQTLALSPSHMPTFYGCHSCGRDTLAPPKSFCITFILTNKAERRNQTIQWWDSWCWGIYFPLVCSADQFYFFINFCLNLLMLHFICCAVTLLKLFRLDYDPESFCFVSGSISCHAHTLSVCAGVETGAVLWLAQFELIAATGLAFKAYHVLPWLLCFFSTVMCYWLWVFFSRKDVGWRVCLLLFGAILLEMNIH